MCTTKMPTSLGSNARTLRHVRHRERHETDKVHYLYGSLALRVPAMWCSCSFHQPNLHARMQDAVYARGKLEEPRAAYLQLGHEKEHAEREQHACKQQPRVRRLARTTLPQKHHDPVRAGHVVGFMSPRGRAIESRGRVTATWPNQSDVEPHVPINDSTPCPRVTMHPICPVFAYMHA